MEREQSYKIYSTVKRQEVKWLWYPYIPYGKLTLLQGDPGDGKSTFMINIAASLTCGGILPDGESLESAGNVIYQGAEDNVGDICEALLSLISNSKVENFTFADYKNIINSLGVTE